MNNLSIKKLLQFWSLSTVAVIAIITAGTLYTHSLFDAMQVQLTEKVIPASGLNRQISNLATALATREKQLLLSNLTGIDSENAAIDELEQMFADYWQRLQSSLKEDEAKKLADQLMQHYEQFMQSDKQLMKSIGEHRKVNNLFSSQVAQVEGWQREITELLVGLGSANSLEPYRNLEIDILKLNNLVSEVEHAHQTKLALSELKKPVNATFLRVQRDIRQVRSLAALSIKQIRELERINEQLYQIKQAAIDGEDSLYQLHEQQFSAQKSLMAEQKTAIDSLNRLVDNLNVLSLLIKKQSLKEANSSKVLADKARWFSIGLALLVGMVMLYFISMVMRSINEPLDKLRGGLHALSSHKFNTRLALNDYTNEFALLASDFNQVASTTQLLIDDLDAAKYDLEDRQSELTTLLNGVPEAIISLTLDGKIESVNHFAEKVLNAKSDELLGSSFLRFFDESEEINSMPALVNRQQKHKEFKGLNFEGEPFTMWLSVNPISRHEQQQWVCVLSDVTVWKQTEQALQNTSSELDTIYENAMVGIAFMKDRRLVRVNRKFEEIFGYSKESILGHSLKRLCIDGDAFEQLALNIFRSLEQDETYESELEFVKKNGQKFWCSLSSKAISSNHPEDGTIWIFEDITQQRESEAKLRDLASLDSLTGLPNRSVFNDRLMHAIRKAQRNSQRLAIFFLDLDHFKHINDSLGHKAGDQLLCEVANRLKYCIREGDTVARLGGDEFTIILEDIQSVQYVAKVAEKVINSVIKTYTLGTTEVNISPSIGVSLYPADGRDVDVLVRNADAAMYHAKNSGRNNFQFYSVEMNAQAAQRLEMETNLRRAVENEDFYLNFQPQIDLETHKIVGAEALLRWESKKWGRVSPDKFIPILEDTGLISVVGEQVLRQACEVYMSLKDHLDPDFKMAVNLSGRQFKGTPLAVFVKSVLSNLGMSANNLELEITESILMEDTELAIKTLNELSELGVTLAVDDFGTGYSSLSYLKQFPLNILKIDKSFIDEVTEPDGDDAAIVDAILAMSGHLHLEVVAEGIETSEQLSFLEERQCQRGQGYFFSKPLGAVDFESLIKAENEKMPRDVSVYL